jgi:hypothetical protein
MNTEKQCGSCGGCGTDWSAEDGYVCNCSECDGEGVLCGSCGCSLHSVVLFVSGRETATCECYALVPCGCGGACMLCDDNGMIAAVAS